MTKYLIFIGGHEQTLNLEDPFEDPLSFEGSFVFEESFEVSFEESFEDSFVFEESFEDYVEENGYEPLIWKHYDVEFFLPLYRLSRKYFKYC